MRVICSVEGCERSVFVSPYGGKYIHCAAHIRALLTGAFREPKPATSWHERARRRELPGMVIGGERIR